MKIIKGRLDINAAGIEYQKTRSPAAFDIIYEFVRRVSRSYCFKWQRGRPDEILSSSIEKVITKIHQFDVNKGGFHNWLYQIVKNELRLYIRDQRFTNKNVVFDDTSTNNTETFNTKKYADTRVDVENVYQPELDEVDIDNIVLKLYVKVMDIIYNLSDYKVEGMEKKCLIKWHIEKKSYKLISEELDIPQNTAKKHVHCGKKRLKKILEKEEPELSEYFRENINI